MSNHDDRFKEHIYDLVWGSLKLEGNDVAESDVVQNEFEDGSPCEQAYGRMLEAYSRLCLRLGADEWNDPDVEVIINELLAIGRHTSLKMFDYGFHYGSRDRS